MIDFYYTYYGERLRVPLEDLTCSIPVNAVLPVLTVIDTDFADNALLYTESNNLNMTIT